MSKRKTTEEFIKEAKAIWGNKFDYSKTVYINNQTKVIIRCKHHGDFEQSPNSHLRKHGCFKCGREKTAAKLQSGKKEFIKKAQETHGDFYDYSKVKYVKAHKKVIIHCKLHGDFEQKPAAHVFKSGCYECGLKKTHASNRNEQEDIISRFREIHSNKFDYSKVSYFDLYTPIKIICKHHGELIMTPKQHLSGKNCEECNQDKRNKEFILKARKVHGDLYDYSQMNLISYGKKITIKCRKHNKIFKKRASRHLKGAICPKCFKEKNQIKFFKKAKKKFGNLYDYSKTKYIKLDEPVIITCKNHGDFKQSPALHLKSTTPCPTCREEEKEKNFFQKAKSLHGDKFIYNKVNYITSRKKVEIICKKHGSFFQPPNSHLCSSIACPSCLEEYKRNESVGWSFSEWDKAGRESKWFHSYKVYILFIDNTFYKIGKTYNTVFRRFSGFPLDYEIFTVINFDNGIEASLFEVELHRRCSEYKIIPDTEFTGMHECFSSIDPIKEYIEILT